MKYTMFKLLLLISAACLDLHKPATSSPLHTSSRWIVDGEGRRVKLACVNWPSHLETVLAEGLDKQPLDSISRKIIDLGFNCVRFTWPLFIVVNDTLADQNVRSNFESLGLNDSIAGISLNNPTVLDLPIIQAYKKVVSNMGDNKIMVILDNHISKPEWCCSNTDGNGFFGDQYFDPNLWINGLTKMATLFNNSENVIGMSLRNELRGPKQNTSLWFEYMTRGAEAVHGSNPNVLVILSGLSFDTDLSFLSSKQVNLTFSNKLVFEFHWYSFSDGSAWLDNNHNQVCGRILGNVRRKAGFLLDSGFPLFLSEYGVDQRGTNAGDNRYLSCLLGLAAELDLDWAIWALQGSYYLKEGVVGSDEVYGVLNYNWTGVRNTSLFQRFASIQLPFRGPGVSNLEPYEILFHPATGLCMLTRKGCPTQPVELGPCDQSEHWSYTDQQTLTLKDTFFCLQATAVGSPVSITDSCNVDSTTKWALISDSKMHVSTKVGSSNGTAAAVVVCLDVVGDGTVVTNPCKCLEEDKACVADSQWFKIVESQKSLGTLASHSHSFRSEVNVV